MNSKQEENATIEEVKSTEVKEDVTSVEMKEREGEPISKYVKPEISKQLMEMGYSKNVAEKACFFNNNVIEKAIEWIYEHQEDPDFETEERILGEKP